MEQRIVQNAMEEMLRCVRLKVIIADPVRLILLMFHSVQEGGLQVAQKMNKMTVYQMNLTNVVCVMETEYQKVFVIVMVMYQIVMVIVEVV